MHMKNQIIFIHGGDTFETYDEYLAFLRDFEVDEEYFNSHFDKKKWSSSLEEKLGDNFKVISLNMPNSINAKYLEWKIWFENFFPFFSEEVILIGTSLGGIFLTKYLSENNFPKKIKGTFIVAAPFDSTDSEYTLADFILPSNLDNIKKQGGKIYFYHSKDDPVVPFADLEKYRKQLPEANFIILEDRQHFNQEEFPEIIQAIKDL
jgi:uncharacterized protein